LQAETVIEDQGVSMSREELEHWVQLWTPQMQKAAAVDRGDRIELLNMALVAKKMALEAESVTPEKDPEAYWQMQFAIRNVQRNYVAQEFLKNLEVPDMKALAEERYITEKDKYAFVPEVRTSSHILFACRPGSCDVPGTQAQAREVLEQIRSGADFEQMVAEHSDDPGTKAKGGKFDRWLRLGEPNVSPPYVGAVFEVEKVGDYSEVFTSEYGFHIVRLDGIREAYYKSFEEVEQTIVDTLVLEYETLAMKEFDARYHLSDDVQLNDEALDEIFAPFKPETLPLEAGADAGKEDPADATQSTPES
jgi:parvulin-like peptidyl-prolyl isomerase